MNNFIGVYIKPLDDEEFLLCVARSANEGKSQFLNWYKSVGYKNLAVRYTPVLVGAVEG